MRRNRGLLLPVAIAATAIVGAAAGVRLYMGRRVQDRLEWDEHLDLVLLREPLPRPGFLVCPPGYCQARPDREAPAFAFGWRRLREAWLEMIRAQKRVVLVSTELEGRRLVHVQHSPLLAFPDIVTIEFVALAADRSSLALYSRSRYGRRDFGQNRKRVERWLAALETHAAGVAALADRPAELPANLA